MSAAGNEATNMPGEGSSETPVASEPPPASVAEAQNSDGEQVGDDEDQVDCILASRLRHGVRMFQTRWTSGDVTWEPEEHFVDEDGTTTAALLDFLKNPKRGPKVR